MDILCDDRAADSSGGRELGSYFSLHGRGAPPAPASPVGPARRKASPGLGAHHDAAALGEGDPSDGRRRLSPAVALGEQGRPPGAARLGLGATGRGLDAPPGPVDARRRRLGPPGPVLAPPGGRPLDQGRADLPQDGGEGRVGGADGRRPWRSESDLASSGAGTARPGSPPPPDSSQPADSDSERGRPPARASLSQRHRSQPCLLAGRADYSGVSSRVAAYIERRRQQDRAVRARRAASRSPDPPPAAAAAATDAGGLAARLAAERAERLERERQLEELRSEYDQLVTRYAEAETFIDRMRFLPPGETPSCRTPGLARHRDGADSRDGSATMISPMEGHTSHSLSFSRLSGVKSAILRRYSDDEPSFRRFIQSKKELFPEENMRWKDTSSNDRASFELNNSCRESLVAVENRYSMIHSSESIPERVLCSGQRWLPAGAGRVSSGPMSAPPDHVRVASPSCRSCLSDIHTGRRAASPEGRRSSTPEPLETKRRVRPRSRHHVTPEGGRPEGRRSSTPEQPETERRVRPRSRHHVTPEGRRSSTPEQPETERRVRPRSRHHVTPERDRQGHLPTGESRRSDGLTPETLGTSPEERQRSRGVSSEEGGEVRYSLSDEDVRSRGRSPEKHAHWLHGSGSSHDRSQSESSSEESDRSSGENKLRSSSAGSSSESRDVPDDRRCRSRDSAPETLSSRDHAVGSRVVKRRSEDQGASPDSSCPESLARDLSLAHKTTPRDESRAFRFRDASPHPHSSSDSSGSGEPRSRDLSPAGLTRALTTPPDRRSKSRDKPLPHRLKSRGTSPSDGSPWRDIPGSDRSKSGDRRDRYVSCSDPGRDGSEGRTLSSPSLPQPKLTGSSRSRSSKAKLQGALSLLASQVQMMQALVGRRRLRTPAHRARPRSRSLSRMVARNRVSAMEVGDGKGEEVSSERRLEPSRGSDLKRYESEHSGRVGESLKPAVSEGELYRKELNLSDSGSARDFCVAEGTASHARASDQGREGDTSPGQPDSVRRIRGNATNASTSPHSGKQGARSASTRCPALPEACVSGSRGKAKPRTRSSHSLTARLRSQPPSDSHVPAASRSPATDPLPASPASQPLSVTPAGQRSLERRGRRRRPRADEGPVVPRLALSGHENGGPEEEAEEGSLSSLATRTISPTQKVELWRAEVAECMSPEVPGPAEEVRGPEPSSQSVPELRRLAGAVRGLQRQMSGFCRLVDQLRPATPGTPAGSAESSAPARRRYLRQRTGLQLPLLPDKVAPPSPAAAPGPTAAPPAAGKARRWDIARPRPRRTASCERAVQTDTAPAHTRSLGTASQEEIRPVPFTVNKQPWLAAGASAEWDRANLLAREVNLRSRCILEGVIRTTAC